MLYLNIINKISWSKVFIWFLNIKFSKLKHYTADSVNNNLVAMIAWAHI